MGRSKIALDAKFRSEDLDEHRTTDGFRSLLKQGLRLEYTTMSWNVVAVGLLLWEALRTRSIAILGFGLDSFIEIGASMVVIWQLREGSKRRERQDLRIVSILFAGLAAYIGIASSLTLLWRVRPGTSTLGILWLLLTFFAMLALAAGKESVGKKWAITFYARRLESRW